MMAATMAGIAFSNASVALVHGMSRPIGVFFHVPHGLSNAMLLPAVTAFSADAAAERYADCARAMGVAGAADSTRPCAIKKLVDGLYRTQPGAAGAVAEAIWDLRGAVFRGHSRDGRPGPGVWLTRRTTRGSRPQTKSRSCIGRSGPSADCEIASLREAHMSESKSVAIRGSAVGERPCRPVSHFIGGQLVDGAVRPLRRRVQPGQRRAEPPRRLRQQGRGGSTP